MNDKIGVFFHIHLISDSTGETLNALAKATFARFENIIPIEHMHVLVRSEKQITRVLSDIDEYHGIVLHTIVDGELRQKLENHCRELNVPALAVLDPLVVSLSRYLGASVSKKIGAQHTLDNDYFNRIEALNFAIAHDDGALADRISQADVVLVGVSRTSKTPTCIYLAHRGYKAANIPLVPGRSSIPELEGTVKPLVVGLIATPERLVQIRKNRLLALNKHEETPYTDLDAIRQEIISARRLYERFNWPVIDVTRRSIEETAATIISILQDKPRLK